MQGPSSRSPVGLERRFPQALRAVLLTGGPGVVTPCLSTPVDAENRFVREHELPRAGLLLVRPDGYFGWAGAQPDAALEVYLGQWLR